MRNCVALAGALLLIATAAAAQAADDVALPDKDAAQADKDKAANAPRVGQHAFAEADAQLGSFTALRLKVRVFSGSDYNVLLEGMYGSSAFSYYGFYPATAGLGARVEFYFGSGQGNTWSVAPGVDVDYVFVSNSPPSTGQGALENAFSSSSGLIPTPIFSIAPNVDIQWTNALTGRLALALGARLGVDFALTPVDTAYSSFSSTARPDLDFYIGLRF